MSDSIRQQVSAFLSAHGITYNAVYMGVTVRDITKADPNGWTCDEWKVSFVRPAGTGVNTGIPSRQLRTEFYTGTGHRKQILPMATPPYRQNTLAYEQWAKTAFKPQAPHAADVLHSMILDSEAVGMSFVDWCDNFGYDSDSIKARNIYDACCAIGQSMRKLFSRQELETIRGMLQDY